METIRLKDGKEFLLISTEEYDSGKFDSPSLSSSDLKTLSETIDILKEYYPENYFMVSFVGRDTIAITRYKDSNFSIVDSYFLSTRLLTKFYKQPSKIIEAII